MLTARSRSTGSASTSMILQSARLIDTRVTPAEERVTAAEQNAQRLSGQIDELMAISNAAKGGAKAAQETADAAVAGVNATNKRISDLDDYTVQTTATVNFKVASYCPFAGCESPARPGRHCGDRPQGLHDRGHRICFGRGQYQDEQALSERRAQAVHDYLIEHTTSRFAALRRRMAMVSCSRSRTTRPARAASRTAALRSSFSSAAASTRTLRSRPIQDNEE